MTLNRSPELATRPGAPRLIYRKPDVLADRSTHYCPGCGHGIVHRLLAEVMTELDLPAHTIAVARSAAPFSLTTTSTSTSSRLPMDGRLPWRRGSAAFDRRRSC